MQKGVLMFDLDFILTSLGFIVPVILVIIIITQGYVKAPGPRIHHIRPAQAAKSAHRTGRHQNPLFLTAG